MWIATKFEYIKGQLKRTMCVLCDFCSNEINKRWALRFSQKHYCNTLCANKAKLLDELTCAKRNNSIRKSHNKISVKEKKRQISLIIQNTESVRNKKSESLKKKWKEDSYKNKVSSSLKKKMSTPEAREKNSISQLNCSQEIKEKRAANLRKIRLNDEVQNKLRIIHNSSFWREKMKEIGKSTNKKRHDTKKKNGTYLKSKIEDDLYLVLSDIYNEIERQLVVNNWNIDFYIKDINTYLQFDGIYWHGLNRELEEIKLFKNKQDKVIYNTYCRDMEQNKYFKENNFRLLRLTDKQFKNMCKGNIKCEILKFMQPE